MAVRPVRCRTPETTPARSPAQLGVGVLLAVALMAPAACSGVSGLAGEASQTPSPARESPSQTSGTPAGTSTPTLTPAPTSTPTSAPTPGLPGSSPDLSAPWPRARVSIPSIGVDDLRVVPYRGEPDDGPGTSIQDRGVAASPRGPEGGVGPGEIGNMIVTAHRTSAGGPLRELPSVRRGEHVLVTSGGWAYDYEVTGTMTISFRSERSKARQTAAVPGRPGREPTRAMITLSTCATPEDIAAGNLWKDEFGNLEHRIDKVGVLVGVRPAA